MSLAADYPVLHTQDCISARAACQVRDGARGTRPDDPAAPTVIRTVHHVDDFTSPSLIECQRQAILEPDRILVVSEHWRDLLRREYGTAAEVVHNGVDTARFQQADPGLAAALRRRAGAADRPLILSVGGIEPRKGSDTLVRAIAALKQAGRRPVHAVVGGHSFQDYRAYRDRVLASLPGLGLRLDDDVVLLGTVPDAELPAWYAAADVLAFPSTKEGWGLARPGGDERGAAGGRVRPAGIPRIPEPGPGRPAGAGGRRARPRRGSRRGPGRPGTRGPAALGRAGDVASASPGPGPRPSTRPSTPRSHRDMASPRPRRRPPGNAVCQSTSGSRRLGSPPRHTITRPARVSSARNRIAAAAMSASVSTGGRAAS